MAHHGIARWTEIISDFVRRTGQGEVDYPIVPEVKELVSIARTQGLACDGTTVTITDQIQVRMLLEAIPLLPGMTIDFDDMGPASAPALPSPKAATSNAKTGSKPTCAGTKVSGGPCGQTIGLKPARNGKLYDKVHFAQGDKDPEPAPAPVAPAVKPASSASAKNARQQLKDIIRNRSGKSRDELRVLMNPLLRQLKGFEDAVHSRHMGRIRQEMLDGKVDPVKFRWDDVTKAPKPKGTVKASPATSSPAPGSASPPPKKSTKGAKKVKTSGSKPKKAPKKTPKPTATTAPTKKKGAKSAPVKTLKGSDPMPSKDDLRKKYIKKAEGDADDVQFHIELYGEFMMQDPPKVDAATALYKGAPPAAKKAIDRLYRSADEVSAAAATKSGKGKTPAGMNKADYDAAKAKAEQLKADGKDRGEATFELATLNVDPDIINAVITEVYV